MQPYFTPKATLNSETKSAGGISVHLDDGEKFVRDTGILLVALC